MRIMLTVLGEQGNRDVVIEVDDTTTVATVIEALGGQNPVAQVVKLPRTRAPYGLSDPPGSPPAQNNTEDPSSTTLWRDGRPVDPHALAGEVLRDGDRVTMDASLARSTIAEEPNGMTELRIVGGPSAGTVHRLSIGAHLIGSSEISSVVVRDPILAPEAFIIRVTRDTTTVEPVRRRPPAGPPRRKIKGRYAEELTELAERDQRRATDRWVAAEMARYYTPDPADTTPSTPAWTSTHSKRPQANTDPPPHLHGGPNPTHPPYDDTHGNPGNRPAYGGAQGTRSSDGGAPGNRPPYGGRPSHGDSHGTRSTHGGTHGTRSPHDDNPGSRPPYGGRPSHGDGHGSSSAHGDAHPSYGDASNARLRYGDAHPTHDVGPQRSVSPQGGVRPQAGARPTPRQPYGSTRPPQEPPSRSAAYPGSASRARPSDSPDDGSGPSAKGARPRWPQAVPADRPETDVVWPSGPPELEGTPLDGAVEWPENMLLTCGSSVFTRTSIEPRDAHLAPAADGGLAYNRPPRLRRPEPERRFERPMEPRKGEGIRLQLLAAFLPAVVGVVLALVLGQWYFLLIALMTPLIMIGQWWSDRRHGKKQHRKAVKGYKQRLAAYENAVEEARLADERTRRADAPDPAEVLLTAVGPRRRLWERRVHDPDALRLRVGLADLPANLELVEEQGGRLEPPTCRSVPVALPMRRLGVAGVTGPRSASTRLAGWLVSQAATLHSPRDLAIVVLSAHADGERRWSWVRWLPHCAPRGGEDCVALVGTDPESAAQRVAELAALIDERQNTAIPELSKIPTGWDDLGGPESPAFSAYDERPYDVLVLLDGAHVLRGLPGMPQVLRQGPRAGVYTLALDDDQRLLPEECATVAACGADSLVRLCGGGLDAIGPVLADQVSTAWCERLARGLAPIRDVSRDDESGSLPDSARLLDLLGLPAPTGRQLAARWRPSGTTRAVIGIGPDGPYTVDLRLDGPHALIAGTTGAGKSEFLQTLICALAVANRPEQLSFVLIDYKGGAAFKECVRLPHTVGMVSDLDGHLTQRALDSLGAEIRRRERLLLDTGTKDIDDYTSLLARPGAPDRPGLPVLPRLVLIIDEFAALVAELPDFVTGLVDIARRGRSLGIHLILATQRPAGVVTADIQANTSLRIALRVTEPVESTDVIDQPDAAHISKATPGRCYVKSGAGTATAVQTARVGGRSLIQPDHASVTLSAHPPAAPPPHTHPTAPHHPGVTHPSDPHGPGATHPSDLPHHAVVHPSDLPYPDAHATGPHRPSVPHPSDLRRSGVVHPADLLNAGVVHPADAVVFEPRQKVRVVDVEWRSLGRRLPQPPEPAESSTVTDLTLLADALVEAASLTGAVTQPSPWLDPLPQIVILPAAPVRGSAGGGSQDGWREVAPLEQDGWREVAPLEFGVTDRPWAQDRQPLSLDLAHGGHLLIAGTARSGRTTVLRTIAGSVAASASPSDVHLHAIDCGSGGLLPLVALPHCGAVVNRDQIDRVERLLARLRAEVGRRQQLLAEAGHASLAEYRQAGHASLAEAGQRLPWLVLMIDRWEGFVAAFEGYDYGRLIEALLQLLREGPAVGLRAVVTGDRSCLLGQVSTVFDERLVLRLADAADYGLAGLPMKDLPARMPPGRALSLSEHGLAESQIALLAADPSGQAQVAALQAIARTIPHSGESQPGSAWAWDGEAPFRVDALPARITVEQAMELNPAFVAPSPLWALMGVGGDALTPMGIDLLAQGPGAVVAGPPRSGRSSALVTAARSLMAAGTPVIAVAPRRSPLRDLQGALAVLDGNATGLQELLTGLSRYVVLVDDAELVGPDSPLGTALEETLRSGRDGEHGMIIAGATADLATAYRGFVAEARKARTGLLLAVQSPADGDLFTIRLPRGAVGGPQGRGLLITLGTATPVQAALS
ncbi:FtsK/SpoIIIE domain-containing protein [Nonomuraea longicatena]|uniref:FtsK domain-containing protein n=1 Tax=Nonomuraea longicatena TaxID=83682 RepID=A0ABN1P501_9ACTN